MINVHEAKSSLSSLLARVERGEEIVIARNGMPVARLTRIAPAGRRMAGGWKNLPGWQGFAYDKTLFAPMTDQEIEAEGFL